MTAAWNNPFSFIWLILIAFCLPFYAQELPAGTTLETCLLKPTGSRISQPGDGIDGITIAPIAIDGEIVVPQGSKVIGAIESVTRFGFGLKQTTASMRYQFYTLQLPNGNAIPIQTELMEVENAKERIQVDGTVRGIHPAASLSSSLDLFAVPFMFIAPAIGVPVWGVKSIIAPSANAEIYFPAGTELILRLTAPAVLGSTITKPPGITSFSPDEERSIRRLLNDTAQQALRGTHPSDLVNLLFLGSREEMDRAFHAAGWSKAEGKSPLSLFRMYHALAQRVGYGRAPMDELTLNGTPSSFVYQKSLDTVQKRHHVRFWKEPYQPNVWLGTAAEDIAFRFELAHWTHSTAPYIDRERAKVLNDLAYTGCLDAAGLTERKATWLRKDPGGKRLIVTDGKIAELRLNECKQYQALPRVEAASKRKPRSRIASEGASLRNGVQMNVFFTTYNAWRIFRERRTAKPLRHTPSSDLNPPGLEWLSALPPRVPSRPPGMPGSSR